METSFLTFLVDEEEVEDEDDLDESLDDVEDAGSFLMLEAFEDDDTSEDL